MSLNRFDPSNDIVILPDPAPVVTSTWTGNDNNLGAGNNFTSSVQSGSNTSPTGSVHFFLDVYNEVSTSANAEVQYSLAYGHRYGSGSPDFTNDTGSFGLSATRVNYNQYRQLVFRDETQYFTFGSHTPDHIFIININRSRYKQKLSAGSLDLVISGANIDYTLDSNIRLTDDSVSRGATPQNPNYVGTNLGGYYNIVSGSNGIMQGSTINQKGGSSSYGFFYPHAGLIILNADMFTCSVAGGSGITYPKQNIGLSTNRDLNNVAFFNAISQSSTFIIDSEEDINSQFYFVRARNSEFNYTNNPSFTSGSQGEFAHPSMYKDPHVYITSIGLYNDRNELLAVAKLSKPLLKSFTREALIRVKLEF